jgi:aminoglycoside phosphotransferase family enzyme/predicted kinase
MNTEDHQQRIVAWLSDARTHGVERLETVVTHAAMVFLAGERAYKMKRAVKYEYLDFSTLEKRRHVLLRELELNRRTAPQIYRSVVPVYCTQDGKFTFEALDGAEPVEWLLVMKRFDTEGVLDRVAARHQLTPTLIDKLAHNTAEFHNHAEKHLIQDGAEHFARVLRLNGRELRSSRLVDESRITRLTDHSLEFAQANKALLDARAAGGFVRHCHGDLHLGNVALIDGDPIPFDCIEFNDELAQTDTLYDVAFLLMDLIHRGERPYASRFLNAYLWTLPFEELAATLDGLALLPLFISCRAAVRAHVTGRRLSGSPTPEGLAELKTYLDLSEEALAPQVPALVAVGGLSGTGKTTLAREIAPRLGSLCGAVHLRTDIIRKQKAGVALSAPLPTGAYTKQSTSQIYDTMFDLASHVLKAGQSVILDGVFADSAERHGAEAIARKLSVPFTGLWLEADQETMERRLDQRQGDASDATSAVMRTQLALDLGPIHWHRIETAGPVSDVARHALGSCASDRISCS